MNKLENIVVLKKAFNFDIINSLSNCEHFDIVLLLSILHSMDNMNDTLNSVLQLGETHIIELANEEKSLNDKYKEGIKILDYCKNNMSYIGSIDSHVNIGNTRPMYVSECSKDKIRYSRYGKNYLANTLVKSNDYVKIFKSTRKNEERSWIQGINLWTYLCLGGLYPSRQTIASKIEKLDLSNHCDITPWNFILSGNEVCPIDVDDPSHIEESIRKSEAERKYDKQHLLNYVLGIDKKWR